MPRRNTKKEGPHPIDAQVGAKIRELRLHLGLTQSGLAEAVGLTFQQIQKYERASNRVSASTLYRIAEFFKVPVQSLYEDTVTPARQDRLLHEMIIDWQDLERPQRRIIRDLVGSLKNA